MFSNSCSPGQSGYGGVDNSVDLAEELVGLEQIVREKVEGQVVFLPLHAAVDSLEIVVVAPPVGRIK